VSLFRAEQVSCCFGSLRAVNEVSMTIGAANCTR